VDSGWLGDKRFCIPLCTPSHNTTVGTFDEFGQSRENLNISYLPIDVGKYLLHKGTPNYGLPRAGYARKLSDGDVLGAYYRPDTDGESWVEITQIDTIAKTVSGKFDINFKIGDQYLDKGFPASVRFSNGVFDLKIVN